MERQPDVIFTASPLEDDRRHNAALEESQVLGKVKARHVTDLFASNDIR